MIPGAIHVAVAAATAAAPLPADNGGTGALVVVVGGVLWAAGYALACVLWPFVPCWWCSGTGKRRSPSGKAHGKCRHGCDGGKRVRRGRRLLDWWRA